LLKRKKEIEMNHWGCENEYKSACGKKFLWGGYSICAYVLFLVTIILPSEAGVPGISFLLAIITTFFWVRAIDRAQEYKVKIDEYNELKKIPPFEWKDES
jgi:hypothetical protein